MRENRYKPWVSTQMDILNRKRNELDYTETLLNKIAAPISNESEAVMKLGNLFRWWSMMPYAGPFPRKNIMEDMLMNQNYGIKSHPTGKETYLIDDFELDLIPSSRMLKITYVHIRDWSNKTHWPKDKRHEEYSIIVQNRSHLKIAKALAKSEYDSSDKTLSFWAKKKIILRKYREVLFSGEIRRIDDAFSEFMKEQRTRDEEEKKKFCGSIAQGLIRLQECGLLETLKLISDTTECRVNFDIFPGHYSINHGIQEAYEFMKKYGHPE